MVEQDGGGGSLHVSQLGREVGARERRRECELRGRRLHAHALSAAGALRCCAGVGCGSGGREGARSCFRGRPHGREPRPEGLRVEEVHEQPVALGAVHGIVQRSAAAAVEERVRAVPFVGGGGARRAAVALKAAQHHREGLRVQEEGG